MNAPKLTRREFLKLAAATSAVAIPAVAGYGVLSSVMGKYPREISPYIDDISKEFETQNEIRTNGIPIVVIYSEGASNPFGKYLGEILTAEGLSFFSISSEENISRTFLNAYDVVLLSEVNLSLGQIEALKDFVWNGGLLVAMRPDPGLGSLLGIQMESKEMLGGYLQVVENNPITAGTEKLSLQFHGAASLYQLAGADALAWISPVSQVDPLFPAISLNRYGKGIAVAWAYDLAKSVAYTRQGNPEWSDQERDGLDGVRTVDLFKDWIDLKRIAIPQADEQQRLLVKLMTLLNRKRSPFPRLWYFPGNANGILIATTDSHMNPWDSIETIISLVEEHQGHLSVYYSPQLVSNVGRFARRARSWMTDQLPIIQSALNTSYGSPTPKQVDDWRRRGHEFTLHPYVESGLEEGWKEYILEFSGRGYGPLSSTTRTHRILWKGWIESAKLQASLGIGMNLDFYHVGPSFQLDDGKWAAGYFTGSGQPLRFIDQAGRVLSIYQQTTQLADDHLIDWSQTEMSQFSWTGWPKLTGLDAAQVYRGMLDRSIQAFPSAIAIIFHTDPFAVGGESAKQEADFVNGCLSYAAERNIPILSSETWLNFIYAKNNLRIQRIEWHSDDKILEFDVFGYNDYRIGVTLMIPIIGFQKVMIEVDNKLIDAQYRQVSAVQYAVVEISAQPHHCWVKFS